MLLDLVNDSTNATIRSINHSRIDFHAATVPFLVVRFVPIERRRRHRPFLIQHTKFNRALIAGAADWFETVVVLAFVFCDVFFERMHRPVGTGVGDVQEERFVFVGLMMIGKVADGVVADGV